MAFVDDPASMTNLQTLKGWAYVALTALLLFVLIARYKSGITSMHREYMETYEQYKALLEHGNQIIIQVDTRGNFNYVNPVLISDLGYSREDISNLSDLKAIIHPNDIPRFQEIQKHILSPHGKTVKHQLRIRHNNGTWRWFSVIFADGRTLAYVESSLLFIRDINDESVLYERLNEANKRFEHIFQEAPVGYHTSNKDLIITDINKTELDYLGYNRDEVVGKMSWADLLEADELPKFEQHKRDLFEKGKVENFTYNIRRRDGTRRSVILNARGFFDENDELLYTIGNVLDVTDKLRVEEEIQELYNRLHYHIQNTPLGFVEWDKEFRVKVWSGRAEEIFGWSRDEVLGKHPSDWKLVHPDDTEYDNSMMQKMMEGKSRRNVYQLRNFNRQGEVRICEWYNSVLPDADGKLLTVLSLIHDITDQEIARDEIRELNTSLEKKVRDRTRKLEAANKELESFAYSVSHDLRAPLRGIDGFSQALLDQYKDILDKKGKNYLDRVRSATQKMSNLIDDLLSLSRISRSELKLERVSFDELIEKTFDAYKRKNPDQEAELRVKSAIEVSGDPRLLAIMVQNLVDNAWKFSSRQKKIILETGVEWNNEDQVIYIRDFGVGFNMKYYNKMFTAFQRLHSEEEFPGTGIGLATVQRIVHRHSGRIWAESEPGNGAVFYFTLSARDDDPEQDRPENGRERGPGQVSYSYSQQEVR